jgi:fucose permease
MLSIRMETTQTRWDRYVFCSESKETASLKRTSLQVQYVYLAMSCLGIVVNILFFFAKLPEVAQVVSAETQDVVSLKGFFKKYHTIAGFFAEFFYVSACGVQNRGVIELIVLFIVRRSG